LIKFNFVPLKENKMSANTKNKYRPFHETIVEAIERASSSDLQCLATLIKATAIPVGHAKIINAWKKRIVEMAWSNETSVVENLIAREIE